MKPQDEARHGPEAPIITAAAPADQYCRYTIRDGRENDFDKPVTI